MLRVALRNLGRRRGRTALTATMIAFGTALVVISIGLTEATYDTMIDLAARSMTGHFQIARVGYNDRPGLQKTLRDPAGAAKALASREDVVATARRVEAGGLFAAGNHTVAGFLLGVEPEAEAKITSIRASLQEGAWLPAAATPPDHPLPAVLDRALARQLGVGLGGEASFVSQAADGSMVAELLAVVGITDTGSEDPSATFAYLRLDDAQRILVLGHRVHRIVGVAADVDGIDDIVRQVQVPEGDALLGWKGLLPVLHQTIELDKQGAWITLGIVLVLVLFGVVNTMAMAVLERTRELGVMLALGTSPRQIVLTVVAEGFWLSLLAVAGGTGLGALVNIWVGEHGISLGDAAIEYGGVMIDQMTATNTLGACLVAPAFIVLAGTLAALLPAIRAARLQPTEALRS